MSEEVVIQLVVSAERASALAELVKRLRRSDLGRGGLNLVHPHRLEEKGDAEAAIDELARSLAAAGFDPR